MAYSAFGSETECLLGELLQLLDVWHNGVSVRDQLLHPILERMNDTCKLNLSDLYRWDGQAGKDLAHSMQRALEVLAMGVVMPLMEKYRFEAEGLTIVGGCALNVKINSLLAAQAATQGWLAHVPAAPSDAGVMVGAALAVSAFPLKRMDLAFSGPDLFDLPDLQAYATSRSARAVEASACADLFSRDRVVAVMRGRTGNVTEPHHLQRIPGCCHKFRRVKLASLAHRRAHPSHAMLSICLQSTGLELSATARCSGNLRRFGNEALIPSRHLAVHSLARRLRYRWRSYPGSTRVKDKLNRIKGRQWCSLLLSPSLIVAVYPMR